jgi:hypothetical protein
MQAIGATALIDAAQGGTVTDVGGAQVTFPPNSFVTQDGVPVTGEVTVAITPLNRHQCGRHRYRVPMARQCEYCSILRFLEAMIRRYVDRGFP